MVENNPLRRHVLLGTNRIPAAGDEESLVYELRVEEREDSASSQVGGDAPLYPDWVYRHVVIPRLLWEEAEERRQAEARRQPLSSNPDLDLELDPGDYSVRVFSTNYDFEWWRESSSSEQETQTPIEENDKSKSTSINDESLNNTNLSKNNELVRKSERRHRNWKERLLEVTKRREKLQEEKLAKILEKIDKRNERLQNFKHRK